MTRLDANQVIKAVYDEATGTLKTSVPSMTTAIEVSASDSDSVIAVQGIEPRGEYDYIGLVYTNAGATVTKTYRSGGAAGTVVGIVTEVYQDATRVQLNSIART